MQGLSGKLRRAFLVLWFAACALIGPYHLYLAWTLRRVSVPFFLRPLISDRSGVFHLDVDPTGFWWVVSFYVFVTVAMGSLAAFLVWGAFYENRRFSKREARPPVDSAIRQQVSER